MAEELKSIETENIAQTIAKEFKSPLEIINKEYTEIVYALPPGWTTQDYDFEHLLNKPRRKRAEIKLSDTESFIEYVASQGDETHCNIYCKADFEKGDIAFLSVINDHGTNADGQRWRDHTAVYWPKNSVEWKRWSANDKNQMNQLEFATFIEDNLDDIAPVDGMPSRADLLEMILKFESNQDSRLKQHVRLQSGGIELNFVNNDDEQTIQRMKMFEKISIGIPVFDNEKNNYRIDARLRYRTREGKLTFWYELIRADKVFKAAAQNMISEIKTGTGFGFYFGDPNL